MGADRLDADLWQALRMRQAMIDHQQHILACLVLERDTLIAQRLGILPHEWIVDLERGLLVKKELESDGE